MTCDTEVNAELHLFRVETADSDRFSDSFWNKD